MRCATFTQRCETELSRFLLTTSPQEVPVPDRTDAPDPRRWWTLVVLSASLLVIGLDNTILNVALPTLQRDLGASSSQLQWIVDAYMLVFAGGLLTARALGDRFGRKRALTFGVAVFALGARPAALAGSAETLVAARGVMGIGGAFIMPSTLSILTATFPASERGKAIGIWAGCSGIGIALGPVTGGWLLEHSGWNRIFLVNVPFVALALLAGRRLVPESRDESAPRLDFAGFGLSFAGLTALVWGLIEAPSRGWTAPAVLGAFAGAVIALAAFVAWELRTAQPMLPVALFRNARFSASSAAVTLAFFALFGMIFFLTQYFQDIRGYSPLDAGVRMLPVAGGLVLGGPLSAALTARAGAKGVVAGGLTVVASALWLLGQADAATPYWHIAAGLVALGLGMASTMAPATDAIMGSLPAAKVSVGSAVNDTTRTTGGALGVAVLGSLLASGYRDHMDAAVSALTGPARDAASDSLAGAMAVAGHVGGAAGNRLGAAAQDAFLAGMHTAPLVAAPLPLAGGPLPPPVPPPPPPPP